MTLQQTTFERMSGEEIVAAAVAYNAEYMEHDVAVLEAGEPEIRVIACPDIRGGDRIRCIIAPIVRIEGGVYEAAEPGVAWIRWFDGRITPAAQARRARKYLGLADAQVPVTFESGRR